MTPSNEEQAGMPERAAPNKKAAPRQTRILPFNSHHTPLNKNTLGEIVFKKVFTRKTL